ncbi:SDR family oxidoreductase [Alicyclobacillus fastidiosus]|uniref:SDR family oxidoreductase n=1 Tax=Alicyclobacillus fastidiosus TaxID=392011 RepID=A0ABY6ZKD7_9BACL|nr:SDR family oxidoreductase [Alicyclobacillus fastidiosus]WAH43332.1 SDR family oxidoreductase [Alicyclobacillus fastidiosus]GMA65389.1 short-chain dehydrogenase [Alicyclobacillus fastidiosus]
MAKHQLSGIHALVTGASSGLGYAMAYALLKEGATVAVSSRGGQKLSNVVQGFRQEGLDAHELSIDVRSASSIEAAKDWVTSKLGKLDVLVNNAGIGMRTVNPKFLFDPKPFYEVSPEGFRDLIDTNLTGYFLVSRAFAPMMVKEGDGRIINISMNHETMRRKGFVPYGPSRAGAESLSYIMAEDLRDSGVAVNVLLPGGATRTGMLPDEYGEVYDSMPNILSPDVMARPIVFLASPEAADITGERIVATEFDQWLQRHVSR